MEEIEFQSTTILSTIPPVYTLFIFSSHTVPRHLQGPLFTFFPQPYPEMIVKNMEPDPWLTATTHTRCVNSMTALSLSFFVCSMGITVPTSQPLSYALLWVHSSPVTLDSACFWFPHLCL